MRWTVRGRSRGTAIAFLSAVCLLVTACQQKMANQPSYHSLQPTRAFADGRSARPRVDGTVARGQSRDVALTGRKAGPDGEPQGISPPSVVQPDPGSAEAAKQLGAEYENFVSHIPFRMDEGMLHRGRDRYTIFCAVCHDPLGSGYGKIVERGYTAPPSYHIERLRRAPVGYLFAVVREGYGSMPSYDAEISPRDRWAIVAYLRALQKSQHYAADHLTADMRAEQARQHSSIPMVHPSP